MQKLLMTSVIAMIGITSAFADIAVSSSAQVTLEAKNSEKNTYSFYYGTQETNKNHNDMDIEFSDVDNIRLNTMTSAPDFSIGMIADLGEMSCKDIKNDYEKSGSGYPTALDRIKHPMFWFAYSHAMDALQNGPIATEMKVQAGHCYVLSKSTIDRKVIAVFHVDKFIPSQSLTINEIEVFYRGKISEGMNIVF